MSYEGLGDESYTDFKKRFYDRVGDATMFDCDGINLINIVLDGLKVNYVKRGRYKNRLYASSFSDSVFRALKKITAKNKLPQITPGKVFVGLSARHIKDENDKPVSVFFERLFRECGRTNFVFASEGNRQVAEKAGADLSFDELLGSYGFAALDVRMKKRRKAFREWFKELHRKNIFTETEIENIGYALDKFFNETNAWNYFMDKVIPKRIVLSSHYHHEGIIDAARVRKIEVVELQHGLISPEDIFFLYPQQVGGIVHRALFPDRVLVFGEFWKKRLEKGAESVCEKIEIGGYYLYQNALPGKNSDKVLSFISGRKVILVTTQYSQHSHYIAFVEELRKKILEDWCIVVKPHPVEDPGLYAQFNNLPNVFVTDVNLEYLLSLSAIQVSIFSTSLFDGLRFNVCNYSLDLPQFNDYVNSMVESGIAYRLLPGENPVDHYLSAERQQNPKDNSVYFAPFDKAIFQGLLK
jgi:hypothetical protein